MTTDALADTMSRPRLDDLVAGFDANRAPHTVALSGREFTTDDSRGRRTRYAFADTTLRWAAISHGDATGSAAEAEYIAFEVAEDLYFVQFQGGPGSAEATSLVLDLADGRAVTVTSSLRAGDTPGAVARTLTAVHQVFTPAVLDGMAVRGAAAAPTTELVGRRALWVYSSVHAYEHIYLSPHRHTWQCLAGPERGNAGTDAQTTWRVRPGIYLFAWRSTSLPCGAVTIADHRDVNHMRSHGVLFGRDAEGSSPVHLAFGAYGRLLSTTVHPAQYDPAGTLPVPEDAADSAMPNTAVTGPAAAGAWSMR